MQNLERRVAALEQASAPQTKNVHILFQQPGEMREQLEARAAADGWDGEQTILVVSFESPKPKNTATTTEPG